MTNTNWIIQQNPYETPSMKNSKYARLDVSVVVCHHTGDLIYKFIDSINKSVNVKFEIILLTSDSDLALKGIPGVWVHHHEGLPAAKRNAGVRLAQASRVAFFDDDTEIAPDCLHEFMKHLTTEIVMVYGKLYNAEHTDRFDEAGGYLTSTGFIWSRAGQNDVDTGQFDKPEPIFAGKSASCMMWKYWFDKVVGFDEDFGILGEESDLSWRIWLYGKEVWFIPSAIGIHYFNTKWKPANQYYTSKRVQFNGCRNYLTMLTKNLGTEHLWIIPLHMTLWFSAGCAMILSLKIRQGANIFRGMLWYVMKLKTIVDKRRKVQENREVTDKEIWPRIFRKAPRGYYRTRICRYLRTNLHG